MAVARLSERKWKEIQQIAEGWGKLLAREGFPSGPGLDVTLADMEEIAALAAQAVVKGAIETMTQDQAEALGEAADCPTCGKPCPLQRKSREVTVRGGTATLAEPVAHCRRCRRDFFPSA